MRGIRGVFGFRFRVAASPVAGLVPPSLDMGHRTFSCLTKAYVPMLGAGRKHTGKQREDARPGHVMDALTHSLTLVKGTVTHFGGHFYFTIVYTLDRIFLTKCLCDWCGGVEECFSLCRSALV